MTAKRQDGEDGRQIEGVAQDGRLDTAQLKRMLTLPLQPFHDQHDADAEGETRDAGSVRPGEQTLREDALDIAPGVGDTVRPEYDPPEDDEQESQQHLSDLLEGGEQASVGDHVAIFAVLAQQDQREEKQGVVRAPGDEGPVGPVPESADQEDDEGVADDLGLRAAAAAQGDVHIVPEPGGEGDVPSAPELGDVAAEVGNVEVLHRPDAEQLARADGHVRVAGEVAVNLYGIKDRRQQQGASALCLVRGEYMIHVHCAVVGDDHFLEKSPEDLPESVHACRIVEGPGPGELRQQVRRPVDRASQELGEESHVSEINNGIPCGFQFLPIDVDAVTYCLERIETDADGQDEVQQEPLGPAAEEGVGEGCGEEVIVLEDAEDQQVDDDVDGADRLGFIRGFPVPVDEKSADKAEEGREGDQEKESPVPPSIKDVGRNQDKEILQLEVLVEDEPVEQKDYRQKNRKFCGIK